MGDENTIVINNEDNNSRRNSTTDNDSVMTPDYNNDILKKTYEKVRSVNIEKDIISFRDFIQKVKDNYWGPRISNSLTLDLFAIYLNAQKVLYIESKEHCENTLHWLMLPAIFISIASSVISLGLKGYDYGGLIVAALTAFDTFLLSIISFTKLDAKAEAHKTSSYRFDKLQVKCQFYSGKALLLGSVNDDITSEVKAFVETIEKQIDDIKDSNQFIIPAIIRYRYPTIYSVNIFSEVKRIKTEEKLFYNSLHRIYNKLENEVDPRIIESLTREKDTIFADMIKLYNRYSNLNKFIEEEVLHYIKQKKNQEKCCCFRSDKYKENDAPTVDQIRHNVMLRSSSVSQERKWYNFYK